MKMSEVRLRPVETLTKDWSASCEPLAPTCFDFIDGKKKRETEEMTVRSSEREMGRETYVGVGRRDRNEKREK